MAARTQASVSAGALRAANRRRAARGLAPVNRKQHAANLNRRARGKAAAY